MSYRVTHPPTDDKAFREWVYLEFQRLQQELAAAQEVVRLATTNQTPAKPRAGDIRLSDNTGWSPGSAGFWGYYAGSWVKLG